MSTIKEQIDFIQQNQEENKQLENELQNILYEHQDLVSAGLENNLSATNSIDDRDINAAINILYRGLEIYLQSQLILLNEQIKNGYFSTVFFQVASQWLKQTISYFNQALETA